MSDDLTWSNQPWWFEIYRAERRWSSLLARKGKINSQDESFLRQHEVSCLVISTLMVLLNPFPGWRFAGRCFFVSFGGDELRYSAIRSNPRRFISLDFGWRALFKGPRLGFVLNSLYLLINRPHGLPRWGRKYLLACHFRFLSKLLPQLNRNIFLVKQDYFGPSSLLVTMSWHLQLHVAGVQHGLMGTESILQQRIYPGIRTKMEYAYNAFYRDIFSRVKSASTITEVMGPPFECPNIIRSGTVARRVVFVSSGQMRSKEGRHVVDQVRAWAEGDGLIFLLRPHPSEKDFEDQNGFRIEGSPVSTLFDTDPASTLFIGISSSLLYQAAFKGFSTLWLFNESWEGAHRLPFLADLPNATFLAWDKIESGTLSSCLNRKRDPISIDSASVRLTTLLQAFFPGILE
jgi:hypothetical protein